MPKPRILDLETLRLESGGHSSPDKGFCVMEAVAFVAGEPFSDPGQHYPVDCPAGSQQEAQPAVHRLPVKHRGIGLALGAEGAASGSTVLGVLRHGTSLFP